MLEKGCSNTAIYEQVKAFNVTGNTLWVCWRKPSSTLSHEDCILSFLSPHDEKGFPEQNIVRARERFLSVEEKARKAYIDIVASIGIARDKKGKTFRQALAGAGKTSQWWWHPVSAKNCEYDDTFYFILSVLAIDSVLHERNFSKLVLVGAPAAIIPVIKKRYPFTAAIESKQGSSLIVILKAIAQRALSAFVEYRNIRAARRYVRKRKGPFDIAFTSFWDWSVRYNFADNTITDRYYAELPHILQSRKPGAVCWFAWLDKSSGFFKSRSRRYRDVLDPVNKTGGVIVLQQYVSILFFLKIILDIGGLFKYLRIRKEESFKRAFVRHDFDFSPIFEIELLKGFVNWSIPLGNLVEEALKNACKIHKPSLCFTFQEHFLFSRAVYSGTKTGNENTRCYTVQHASYSPNKTFLFFDPVKEFAGEPDGCAVPHPSKVFAMGSLGQQLFLECGYSEDDVLLTGSPRYDTLARRSLRMRRPQVRGAQF